MFQQLISAYFLIRINRLGVNKLIDDNADVLASDMTFEYQGDVTAYHFCQGACRFAVTLHLFEIHRVVQLESLHA